MIQWVAFLADGTIMDSTTHTWDQVPDQVIALKVRYPDRKLLLFGLSHYGHPDTLKVGPDIPDAVFARILSAAYAYQFPPPEVVE